METRYFYDKNVISYSSVRVKSSYDTGPVLESQRSDHRNRFIHLC